MLKKQQKQYTIADLWLAHTEKLWNRHWLKKVLDLVNWVPLEVRISKKYHPDLGRGAIPPLVLFRSLLLAEWYSLSDRQLEEALEFRIDFRKFAGLSYGEEAPDATTFCVFRERIKGIWKVLLKKLNIQLDRAGYKVKEAIAVDATLVAAHSKPQGGKGGDPEGSWRGFPQKEVETKDGEKALARRPALYGYKVNAATSIKDGFISDVSVCKASEHETHHLKEFLTRKTRAVYADKGYVGNKKLLKRRKIRNGIMSKATRGHKLTSAEVERNKRIVKKRRIVEGIFGSWKQWYGWLKTKYWGLERNSLKVGLTAIAWNMKKWAKLAA